MELSEIKGIYTIDFENLIDAFVNPSGLIHINCNLPPVYIIVFFQAGQHPIST